MKDEVRPLLGAYHDGELDPARSGNVEAHLARCAACRRELAALERLSSLLAAAPAPAVVTAPDRFAARVALRLPRRPEPPAWPSAARAAWWSVPVMLLLAWAVVQAVLITTTLVLAALNLGLGGDVIAGALPAEGIGLAARLPLASGSLLGAAVAALLEHLPLLLALAWLAIMAVGALAYWSWLASLRATLEQRGQQG